MGKLFGSSGIRGIVNEKITPKLALDLGLSLGTYLGNLGNVVIGIDQRTSGVMLKNALISGLLSAGCDVDDIGVAPTPTIAYVGQYLEADSAISITASHNPPEYNGIKIWNPDGRGYASDQEDDIENILFKREYLPVGWDSIGTLKYIPDAYRFHVDAILEKIKVEDSFKVVLNTCCGATSVIAPIILKSLEAQTITLNANLDGHFFARNVSGKAGHEEIGDWHRIVDLANLINLVSSTNSDIGIAHDGDGDRVLFIDEKGQIIPPDVILAVLAVKEIEKHDGGIIVTTVDASSIVKEEIEKAGGKIVFTKVGDVFVSEKIKEKNAIFGGEPSGTYIFPELHLCPDGLFTASKVLELMSTEDKRASELFNLRPYPIERFRFEYPQKTPTTKAEIMSEIKQEVTSFKGIQKIDTIDGVLIFFNDKSKVLVRPSGTEPIIRLTCEAKTRDRLKTLSKIFGKKIKELIDNL